MMKKIFMITSAILTSLGTFISSGIASVIEELPELTVQYNSRASKEDNLPSEIKDQSIEAKLFKRSDYERALAQQLNRLNPYNFLSKEEKLETRFKIGEIYYDYAEHTKDLDEKAAFLEQAKIHFEASKFPSAKPYLEKIAIFDESYED